METSRERALRAELAEYKDLAHGVMLLACAAVVVSLVPALLLAWRHAWAVLELRSVCRTLRCGMTQAFVATAAHQPTLARRVATGGYGGRGARAKRGEATLYVPTNATAPPLGGALRGDARVVAGVL